MFANSRFTTRTGLLIILLMFVFLSGCSSNDKQYQTKNEKSNAGEEDIVYCINKCPKDHPDLNCQWMLKDSLNTLNNYTLVGGE